MHPKFKGKKTFYICGAKDVVDNSIFLCPKCKKKMIKTLKGK